jgi:L-alanine-DL-glutamate epimerase-like enolase superfamily enzyme
MKITAIESLHCDAGWRNFSFLKISTNEGLIGYSEYNESYGSPGLSEVIRRLGELLIGQDPRPVERITADLYARTRQAPEGLIQQAIAAIENALLDLKAKALGIPVYELFSGPVRDRLRLYWSHFGTYRLHHADVMGVEPLKDLAGLEKLAAMVVERGFTAMKTNIFLFDEDGAAPQLHMPGFSRGAGAPELNWSRDLTRRLQDQFAAIRAGAGAEADLFLDLNFNFKTEGYLQITRALDDAGLSWFEIDSFDPRALRDIREKTRTPIASCESLFGRRGFAPYFEHHSMDVAIIDVPWNGLNESRKIAAMAEAYEMNVAPHNFYGHLSTLMSAHFCASLPNFRIMEIDIDDVPWKDDLVTEPPRIEDGYLILPTGPGWGADVNEEAVRAHPPK